MRSADFWGRSIRGIRAVKDNHWGRGGFRGDFDIWTDEITGFCFAALGVGGISIIYRKHRGWGNA